MACIRFKAILINTDDDTNGKIVHARCKQWDCHNCARLNKKAWALAIFKFLDANPDIQWSFHTFTFPFTKFMDSDARFYMSVKRIKGNWEKLLKRLKRRYGKFEFVRVLESHKKGGYHIHLMAGFKIPESDIAYRYDKEKEQKVPYLKWLNNDIKSIGFGYIQHSENAIGNGKQAVTYITKYMTKDDERGYKLLKDNKVRIIQTSRGFKSPFNKSSESDEQWTLRRKLYYTDFLFTEQYTDLSAKHVITIETLESLDGSYPNYED